MSCGHWNYDEYFEKCHDCGKSGDEIHTEECGQPLRREEDGAWVCDICDALLVDVGIAA